MKHLVSTKGKKPAKKQQKTLEVEKFNIAEGYNPMDPDAIEDELEFEGHEVVQVDRIAAQDLYDPATPYRCASMEVLDRAKAFWTAPSRTSTLLC